MDIRLFRQGGKEATYDENGERLDTLEWVETYSFNCVEHVAVNTDLTNTIAYGAEQERQLKKFYIEMRKQDFQANLDINLGDYIKEACGDWWKLLGVQSQEIIPGCHWLRLTGERLTQRETKKLRLPHG